MNQHLRHFIASTVHASHTSNVSDLLDQTKTSDNLLGMLGYLLSKGITPLITSLRTDHGDDSSLGPHCHAHGYAVDLCPTDGTISELLEALVKAPHVEGVGLGGCYAIDENLTILGGLGFKDNNQTHVHVQVHLNNVSI